MGAARKSRGRPPPLRAPPAFVEVMLARDVAELPADGDWIREIKWDGYRVLGWKSEDTVRLVSRNNKVLTRDFPGVAASIGELASPSVLLDGEVVALDETGRPSFQMLKNRRGRSGALYYYAYDLLWLDGEDWRERPLKERKEKLAKVVAGTSVRFSKGLPGDVSQVVRAVQGLGLEGVIAKRADSRYEAGERSGSWLKLKLSPEQEFVIGGYKPGAPLESLVVGVYDGAKLICAGKVRQGLNPQNRRSLARLLDPLRTAKCPFANLPNSRKGHWGEGITSEDMQTIVWVKPARIAQVSFTEWTDGGNLRHATYLGLRDDKDPRTVVRERGPPRAAGGRQGSS